MPIEIKELVIRVTLDQDGGSGPDASGGTASPASSAPGAAAQHEIVQECVRQVLQILARERER
jgi:Family of unknown function (DUF5908)